MYRSLELRILSKALKLWIQCRHRGLVALNPAKGNKDHALFEMCDLDAARIMFELDLVPDPAHVMVGKSRMQIYGR